MRRLRMQQPQARLVLSLIEFGIQRVRLRLSLLPFNLVIRPQRPQLETIPM